MEQQKEKMTATYEAKLEEERWYTVQEQRVRETYEGNNIGL